jgi:hypothetical protein
VSTIDHNELASMFVIGQQFTTHRLETVTKLVWREFVKGTPERCPVGDILWLNVIECLTE